uniref:DYW domain-containing protein n=1 Tax=Kalanchoe fedtschenkoi TaxID=63787 RepID=A0A7N0U1C1_KALFE
MYTCESISHLLATCKTLASFKQIQAYAYKSNIHSDPFVAGKFILHCAVAISDAFHHALRLFLDVPAPDVFMCNAIIRGLSESETPQNSISMYSKLRREVGFRPDSFTFAFLLKGVANYRCLRDGVQLHCQAVKHGLDGHLFVGTTTVSMYGECMCAGYARKVFDEMFGPNVVAWNALVTACFRSNDLMALEAVFGEMPFKNVTSCNVMLAGYMKAGETESATDLFSEMDVKDAVSWSSMVGGFAHNGCFTEAFGVFRGSVRSGIGANEVSLTGVLSACAQAGAFEFGRIVHGLVEKSGLNWIITVNNALIDTYARCGNVGMSRLVFDSMPDKSSVVSWTSMITGLAMHGCGKEALQLFHQMESHGVKPDGVTFVSILYACSHGGFIEQGSTYFSNMIEIYGVEPSVEHYGCMVDLYGRSGQLEKAFDFVTKMPFSPTDIIWRILLGACSIHGNVKLAEHVKGSLALVDPDNSGDGVLLSNIYATAGKWRDAAGVRRSMENQQIKKDPGWSTIEIDKVLYSFVAGDKRDKITEKAHEKLDEIMLRVRVEGGYMPEVASVLHDIQEEEKEDAVTRHSEKLALAFGLARSREGRTIRIMKNLRVCRDCHSVMKLVSKLYRVQIVLRDRSRFHTFDSGFCSCRDYW